MGSPHYPGQNEAHERVDDILDATYFVEVVAVGPDVFGGLPRKGHYLTELLGPWPHGL